MYCKWCPSFLNFLVKVLCFIIQKSSKYSMNVSVKIQCEGLAPRDVNFLLVQ